MLIIKTCIQDKKCTCMHCISNIALNKFVNRTKYLHNVIDTTMLHYAKFCSKHCSSSASTGMLGAQIRLKIFPSTSMLIRNCYTAVSWGPEAKWVLCTNTFLELEVKKESCYVYW